MMPMEARLLMHQVCQREPRSGSRFSSRSACDRRKLGSEGSARAQAGTRGELLVPLLLTPMTGGPCSDDPATCLSPFVIRPEQLDVTDAERLGDLVKADDGGVALPTLEPAQVLLAEARPLLDLLLGEPLGLAQAGEVAADQPAHVHLRRAAVSRSHSYQL